jgi:alkaline phosphatase D
MKTNSLLFAFIIASTALYAQHPQLKAGPMPGYSEMKEAVIWLQTNEKVTVYAKYWNISDTTVIHRTNTVTSCREKAFTALLVADTVEPGHRYQYDIFIEDERINLPYKTYFHTQELWRWRKDPPDFNFLAGSCAYINEARYDRPGEPYGGEYNIYGSMAREKADFMIWLGDNLYFREPDWNSRTGIMHRYTHDRSIPELQEFLASTHHYAIWDDHDYGPNNSDRSFWNKNQTREAFRYFWANPSYGVGNVDGAITFFQYADADFYLLDNRTYRTPNGLDEPGKTQLGQEQLQWLFDNLVSSRSTFKFIVLGGQFLSTSGIYEAYTNYGFNTERQRIIDFIYAYDIQNVIFLTGDVHFSEISVLAEDGQPKILDITSSPLNSGVNTNGINQPNTLRVPGSVIMKRNYTRLEISGKERERRLVVSYFNAGGVKLYSQEFPAEYPKPEKD